MYGREGFWIQKLQVPPSDQGRLDTWTLGQWNQWNQCWVYLGDIRHNSEAAEVCLSAINARMMAYTNIQFLELVFSQLIRLSATTSSLCRIQKSWRWQLQWPNSLRSSIPSCWRAWFLGSMQEQHRPRKGRHRCGCGSCPNHSTYSFSLVYSYNMIIVLIISALLVY